MQQRMIDGPALWEFENYLREKERSAATIEKYIRDVSAIKDYLGGREVKKELGLAYKEEIRGAV